MRAYRWLCIAAASVMLAGCSSSGGLATHLLGPSSTFTLAIGVDPDTLDPMHVTTTTVGDIVRMIVESLVQVDQDGKIQPDLATAWQVAPDGMSWTFTVRSAVWFSDGVPFDAAAVKTSFDRALDPSNVCQCFTMPRVLKSVEVVDPEHVRFNLNLPVAGDVFLGLLTVPAFRILSPRAIQKGTPDYKVQDHPVGTGPYTLAARVKGDHLTLNRNENYWGRRPAFRQQVVMVVPDAATREALVRSGQAQMVLLPPASDIPAMQKDPTVNVLLAAGDRTVFIAINTMDRQQPLLQNVQVRQALNYAINRDAIVKSTLFGAAQPMTSTMAPILFGYCQVPNQYRYDPDLARSMLLKANAANLTVTLMAPTGRYIQDYQAAQNIANDLRAVGVNVQGPSTADWPTYLATVDVPPDRASTDLHMLGWAPNYLDADVAMAVFDPSQIPPHGQATAYYDNPAVTALIRKAQGETNRDARAQEYCAAQTQIWNDAPWIFLWVQKFPIVYSSLVTGIASIPTESFNSVYAQPV